MRSGVFWFLAFALALGALIVYLAGRYPAAIDRAENWTYLLYLLLLLLLVGSGILGFRGLRSSGGWQSLSFALKSAVGWIAVIGVLLLGYSYRHELTGIKNRILGEVAPASPVATAAGRLTVRAGPNGHFFIDAEVNGEPVRFLVDTGASDIVLSPADARRVGFDPARLTFSRVYSTANGIVRGAPVVLRSLKIGPLRLTDMPASVNGAAMNGSLLGQSFLKRLKGYSVRNGVLTLDY